MQQEAPPTRKIAYYEWTVVAGGYRRTKELDLFAICTTGD